MKLTTVSLVLVAAIFGQWNQQHAFAQDYSLEQRLTLPDGTPVVAIDGDTAVVGMRSEADPAIGTSRTVGAVFVYTRVGGGWTLQQQIRHPEPRLGDYFGTAVDISGDTLVVGAEQGGIVPSLPGKVYVYSRTGGVWSLAATYSPSAATGDYDRFGVSVVIEGDTIAAGAVFGDTSAGANRGAVYVIQRTGSTWGPAQQIVGPDSAANDFFGVSIGLAGSTMCVGARNAAPGGAAYMFVRSGATWTLQQKLTRPSGVTGDAFGVSCDVDGDTAVVGAPLVAVAGQATAGTAYVFARSGTTWTLQQQISAQAAVATAKFGWVVDVIGDRVAVGAPGTSSNNVFGEVQLFSRVGSTWTAGQRLTELASRLDFGLSLRFDGTALIVSSQAFTAGGYLGGAFIYRSATTPPPTAPGAPTNVQATATGNTLNLTWSAPTSGGAPTSYTLLARTAAGAAPLATVPLGAVRSFAATAPSGTFLLSLTATNAVGTGPESAVATVTFGGTVAPPASPTGFGVSVTGTTATFSWTAPVSGGPPAGYVLLAGLSPGFTSAIASLPLPVSPTSFSIPGVPVGTFYVRLVAQNAGGTSGPSNEVTLTVAGASAPGAPTLNASATGRTVNVSWTPGNGGAPTGYTLSAAVTPGGAPVATVPLGGTSVSFANVPSGTYYLRLTASNGAGTSPASNEVAVAVP